MISVFSVFSVSPWLVERDLEHRDTESTERRKRGTAFSGFPNDKSFLRVLGVSVVSRRGFGAQRHGEHREKKKGNGVLWFSQ